ncbi:hypothetical protein TVAG_107040 [Trichomonas vaginalis G3]|uniref:Uncharacterized protein n=1 Tax=Trichomonas vaginalis (strain ATCC PRA-98 / G3) TaxID=412133 RepID=A2FE45_TRIV3|nr:hypothetical protein TVAGG3_0429990 [Trichomonas vaginalis G3]EAX96817.1 hypothetical protein TVAG_107040 [Trichomonas vaginalis G3]KAI5536686.1 hypothetical protein TVAGG3_0429990 [Trichomonas vaginalis G3]|eukprot:XP_001309747.1 hypothetical protein [Trichomonas vaginalis G3]
MSCRFDSTFSTATFGDLSDDNVEKSSDNKNSVNFREQSRAIEQFLGNNDHKSKDSEAYHLVETLFSLFKTEANMNIELRRVLCKERKKLRSIQIEDTNILNFYKEMCRLSGIDVCSFDDVCEIFITMKQKSISRKNKQSKTIARLQDELAQLKAEYETTHGKLQNAIRQIRNDDNEFDSFALKLKNATVNSEKLANDLKESNSIIKQQQNVILDLKEQLRNYKGYVDESKLEVKDLKDEISNLQRKIDQFSMTDVQKQSENKALVDKLNESGQQLKNEKDRVNELISKCNTLTAEKADITNALHETEGMLNKAVSKIGKLRKKNKRLLQKLQETVDMMQQDYINEMDKNLSEQKVHFEKQIEEFNQANISIEEQNKTLKQTLEKKIDEVKIVNEGISGYKDRISKLRFTVNQYKEENERLRNIMRQQSLQYSKYDEYYQAFDTIQTILNIKGSSPKQIVNSIQALID